MFKEDLFILVKNSDEFLNIQKLFFSKGILWKYFYGNLLSGDYKYPRYILFNHKYNNIINITAYCSEEYKKINAIEILRKEKLKEINNENTI